MLYAYGLRVGTSALLRGVLSREVLKNLIIPANYWRTLEFRLTYDELNPTKSDRILDVGSPKLLSLYLADLVGAKVWSTDIDDYFVADYTRFRKLRGIPEEQFNVLSSDGRALPFPRSFFSKAYAISVLEHIPDDGDSVCIGEIGRTLMPGGTCVVTVPFGREDKDEYKDSKDFHWARHVQGEQKGDKIFFQRRYSEKGLNKRLVHPSGLEVKKILYVGETFPLPEHVELSSYLPKYAGPIHPLLSNMFLSAPTTDWRSLKKPLCAVVVLTNERG
jgi:SAM-dependent methyltransferase